MVVGNLGAFRAHTAQQHQLDATSASLRELEEQAERLRRLLLNGPLEAEDARRAVEARAHEVKTQLQHECDSLMVQTEELRASLKAITAENQTAQRTLDALHKGNSDAERKVAEAKRRLEEAAAEARAAAVAESERAQPLSATASPTQTGRVGEAALSPKHAPASTITSPAPLQLRLEEGVSAVVTLRKRHAAALAAVDKVTAELRAVVQKRSDVDAEVASLRDLRARLDAARADASVAEAQQTLRQHDELAARILEHRRDAAERVRERRGMVEHLVRGFIDRSNSLTAARKRYLARLLGADAETSAVAQEVAHNSAVRKDAAEVLLNTSVERELLENCAAVLGQRCDDLAHRLNQELYDYSNALTLSRLSPARGRAPSESR